MHVTSLTTHPSDPQARIGLSRCMDVLGMMEVLWPSANRALELLRGSKFKMQEEDLALLSKNTDRRKRSAEYSLDDAFDRNVPFSMHQDYLEMRPPPYTSQYGGQSIYPQEIQPPTSLPVDRWPAENSNGSSFGFSGTLSTSVLPQLYSTGLVDDRHSYTIHRPQASHQNHQHPRPSQNTNRYPQYWNDFSTFPQLGSAYGTYQQPSVSQPQHSSSSSHMYLASEPYSIYSE
ncbi:hypothetical protein H0H81_008497 [Sphagnurus paluster]|uniref:Uncharacterized protein n=1 Tax=Sphagnurus paluster TaxID=117069 RepID=A0A9P7K493_9AGAR|nr:hypothetical protein H0H81_008497 [Sphagnurus paluster]